MDDAFGPAEPFTLQTAKKIGHSLIDQLGPQDVAAVGFTVDYPSAQELTGHRGRLHSAIDHFDARLVTPGHSVIRTLAELCELLGNIPERRKVIVYVGAGEPLDLRVAASMNQMMSSGLAASPVFSNQIERDKFHSLLSLFSSAQRANVSIYSLDPTGLRTDANSSATDFLRIVASATGGRVVTENNAPAQETPAILRETASYYLLGFKPENQNEDGRFRRLEVKVGRPGVEVRARQVPK